MAQASGTPTASYYPNRSGAFRQIADTAANDPDKTITVTSGKVWEILHVFQSYAASSDTANRTVTLTVGDGTNTIGVSNAVNVQVADATESYHWIPGTTVPVETIATQHFLPWPGPRFLPAGYTIDLDATNAEAADDTELRVEVIEYDA